MIKNMLEMQITEKLRNNFSPLQLEVINESSSHHRDPSGETHFKILIVSNYFEGKTRIERQRMVQSLFDQERRLGLHALTMTTLTSAEWEIKKLSPQVESPTCTRSSNVP